MEPLWGFLMGFSHTGLIMLQGSLMYTEAHKNMYWRFVLEAWVFVHASMIAVQTMAVRCVQSIRPGLSRARAHILTSPSPEDLRM